MSRKKIAAFCKLGNGWTVCVDADTGELFKPVRSIGMTNLIVTVCTLLASVLIVLIIVRNALDELQRSQDQLIQSEKMAALGSSWPVLPMRSTILWE